MDKGVCTSIEDVLNLLKESGEENLWLPVVKIRAEPKANIGIVITEMFAVNFLTSKDSFIWYSDPVEYKYLYIVQHHPYMSLYKELNGGMGYYIHIDSFLNPNELFTELL